MRQKCEKKQYVILSEWINKVKVGWQWCAGVCVSLCSSLPSSIGQGKEGWIHKQY